MRKTLALALPLVAVTLSGCLAYSLQPLYRDEDTVFRPELVGRWSEDGNSSETWELTRSGDRKYEIVIAEDGKRGVFEGHLVKLGDVLFLDMYPADMSLDAEETWRAHLFPMHTFLIVRQVTPTPSFAPLDDDWVKELVTTTPGAIRHELVGDRVVLTASTSELQAFLVKHATTAKAFGDPINLSRREVPSADLGLLSGEWIGTGYNCPAVLLTPETVRIDITGDSVVATKITGDDCVKAGQLTWRGAVKPGPVPVFPVILPVEIQVGGGGFVAATATVESSRRIVISGSGQALVFVRSDGAAR